MVGSCVDLQKGQCITKLKGKLMDNTRQLLHSIHSVISFWRAGYLLWGSILAFWAVSQVWGCREFNSHREFSSYREFNISQMSLLLEPYCISTVRSSTGIVLTVPKKWVCTCLYRWRMRVFSPPLIVPSLFCRTSKNCSTHLARPTIFPLYMRDILFLHRNTVITVQY